MSVHELIWSKEFDKQEIETFNEVSCEIQINPRGGICTMSRVYVVVVLNPTMTRIPGVDQIVSNIYST